MRKLVTLSLFFSALLVFTGAFFTTQTSGHKDKFFRSIQPISGKYIVVLNSDVVGRAASAPEVGAEAEFLSSVYGGEIHALYSDALKGYSAAMLPEQAEALSLDERVQFVEEDSVVSLADTQTNPGWNLDRIDQRSLPMDSTYTYGGNGTGANVYIIDTGIRTTHTEFGGRADVVFDAINDGQLDCNGHGTHVAGIVGGATFGVAKNVSLHSARVLKCDGNGQISDIVAAIDWVTAHRINPAVANISITAAGSSPSLETALTNSFNSGVLFTVAAGNSNGDACNYSPARTPAALTIGATAQLDDRALFSNFGACVDLFAPGYEIVSAGTSNDTATRQLSGTSMAAPLVAGVAAIYRASNPSLSSATVSQTVLSASTSGIISNTGAGSPNRLLYSWLSGGPAPTPTPTPTSTPTPTPTPTATPTPTPVPTVTPTPTPVPSGGRITIKKQAHNTNGGTSSTVVFPYDATNIPTQTFTLTSDQEFIDPNAPTAGQMIAVTEAPVEGWQLTSVQCVEVAGATPNILNTTVDLANHRANIMVENGESVTCTFISEELAPTAAHASVAGRIVDARGRGVRGVSLSVFDASTGVTTYATTNGFGYYTFADLEVMDFYVLTAFDTRRYTIVDNVRSFTLRDNLANVDFSAQSSFRW